MYRVIMKWIRNVGIAVVVIIIAIEIFVFFMNKKNYLYKIVVENRNDWDISLSQNTIVSGDFMGIIYERDYDVNTLPSNFLVSLVVDYYIDHVDFFNDDNLKEDYQFQKQVTSEELHQIVKDMFGPDVQVELEDVTYGCNRSLRRMGNTYVISSSFPDSCGLFDNYTEYYLSHISDYYREEDNIIVELRVGYIEKSIDDWDVYYNVYTDKTKDNLIQSNYDKKCVSSESDDSSCYENFRKYRVLLKKNSDGKYYFGKIYKIS